MGLCCAEQALAQDNVVHFDLKCDNVLLEPLTGASDAEFWRPGSSRPPFRVVLADFGESRMYASADDAVTVRCVLTHLPHQLSHSLHFARERGVWVAIPKESPTC